ncbi:MAG: PD40 domain-containing protein [Acidobacteriota bacterium]|nr:PD40 domain-containing protein [Acidobacteriota bacterium]
MKGSLPTWSPDGERLAYYSEKSGARQLWVIDLSTLRAEQITRLPGGIEPGPGTRMAGWTGDPLRYSWSPDSKKIVFASQAKIAVRSSQSASGIRPGELKPGVPLTLAPKTSAALSPAMAGELFIVDVSTKALKQLTGDDAVYFNPAWSPDGRTIVCVSSEGRNPRTGPMNLYAIDPVTGRKTALTTDDGDKRLPSWSPDGNWIAFMGGKHSGMQAAFVIPANGGMPVNIAAEVGRSIAEFAWLPDSWSLVLLVRDAANMPIVSVPVSGTPVTSITGEKAADRRYLSVARDGTLAWAQEDGSQYGAIVLKPPSGASPRILVDLNPRLRNRKLGTQEVVRSKKLQRRPA